MSSLPEFNPYEVLGVAKDAVLSDIKSAHRKLVLKCHPDKIQDESQRSKAQDQFQKVQQAYELLSDEASRIKYDQKVRLAELKREMMASGSSRTRSSATREYRDGHFYEERAPAGDFSPTDAFFEDEGRFTEPPRPMSRKHDEYSARPRSRATDGKKKSKPVSSTSARAAKETRESTKATRSDRAKYRTKERMRGAYQKFAHPDSDTYSSDSDRSEEEIVFVTRPSEKRSRDHKSRPSESGHRSEARRRDEEDFSDEPPYKHEMQQNTAMSYIRRSRETVLEPDRQHRPSRSPLRYSSAEPEVFASRHPGRSKRPSRETVRPSTSRHGSFEHLEPPQSRGYDYDKVPSMPTSATFPGPKGPSSPRSPLQPSRSSTASDRSQSKSKRESSRRSEALHLGMGIVYPETSSRTTKLRGYKDDSGYASSSPTPDIPVVGEASPKSSRYKNMPEPVIVEPAKQPPPPLRHARTYSPPRHERRSVPVRSSTYAYPPANPRESPRRLYGEVDHVPPLKEKDIKYAPAEGRPDVTYIHRHPYSQTHHHEDYRQPRRQSAY